MDTLVTTDWLARHLEEPGLVLLDCSVYQQDDGRGGFRNVSGRARYEQGHIPGAGFADLKGDLADSDSPIEFDLPGPEAFCAAMGALGVGDDSRVVLYDASYSAWAARVWWMLRWVGFDRAALLDGGLRAWSEERRPLETGPVAAAAKRLTPSPRPRLIADRDEVLSSIGNESVCLIDTLPAEMYRGETTIYARAGHIPGAINTPGTDLLDETGHFRSDDELAGIVTGKRGARNITYCGGGILASANAFAMHRLGFEDIAVYTASLQEWAADPENPLVVDKPGAQSGGED
jgi:thiosulfate/3-mercaptopyruvate sulfurtransferase